MLMTNNQAWTIPNLVAKASGRLQKAIELDLQGRVGPQRPSSRSEVRCQYPSEAVPETKTKRMKGFELGRQDEKANPRTLEAERVKITICGRHQKPAELDLKGRP